MIILLPSALIQSSVRAPSRKSVQVAQMKCVRCLEETQSYREEIAGDSKTYISAQLPCPFPPVTAVPTSIWEQQLDSYSPIQPEYPHKATSQHPGHWYARFWGKSGGIRWGWKISWGCAPRIPCFWPRAATWRRGGAGDFSRGCRTVTRKFRASHGWSAHHHAAAPLDKNKVLALLSGHWGFSPTPFQCTCRKDAYLVGERLHLDSIPGHCLAWVVCSLHQHLLTQLGQPALHHTASTQARRPSQDRDPGQATLTAPRRPCPSRFRTPCIKTAKQWLQRGPTSTWQNWIQQALRGLTSSLP